MLQREFIPSGERWAADAERRHARAMARQAQNEHDATLRVVLFFIVMFATMVGSLLAHGC